MIRFITIGKFKSKVYETQFNEYLKLIQKFRKTTHEVLAVKTSRYASGKMSEVAGQSETINRFLEKFIEKNSTKKIFLIFLDEQGKLFNSRDFSKKIEKIQNEFSEIWIVAAGPHGFNDFALKQAQLILSLSPFTFAHELATVIAAEQIFRALSILNNHPYHND